MKFSKLFKRVTLVGSCLLFCCIISTTSVVAQTTTINPYAKIRFNNQKIKESYAEFDWSKLNKEEKKQILSKLKALTQKLKEVNNQFKNKFGEDLIPKDIINKLTRLANKSIEKIDEKELDNLIMDMSRKGQKLSSMFISLIMSSQKELKRHRFIPVNNKVKKNKPVKKHHYYILKEDMVRVAPIPYNNGKRYIKSVIQEKDATKVTFVNAIHFSSNWSQFTSSSYLRDLDTDKRYYPIGMENNIPLDSLLVTKGHARQMVEFTVIYPPIDKDAMELIFCAKLSDKIKRPYNGTTYENVLIKLNQFKPVKKGLIIRELLNGRLALCNSNGYRINHIDFDNIKKIKSKRKIYYMCYLNGRNIISYDRYGKVVPYI